MSVLLKVVFTINTYLYKTRLAPFRGTTSSNIPFVYKVSISSAIAVYYCCACFGSSIASLYIRRIQIPAITSTGKAASNIVSKLLLYWSRWPSSSSNSKSRLLLFLESSYMIITRTLFMLLSSLAVPIVLVASDLVLFLFECMKYCGYSIISSNIS